MDAAKDIHKEMLPIFAYARIGLFDHKESTTIRKVESHSPNDAAPHSTRPMAATPL
jgi:hypothetical protein